MSYHAVHSEVLVLGLQLYGVGVVVANLCVACQEQTLIVHDPVEHLRHGGNDRIVKEKKKMTAKSATRKHAHAWFIVDFHRSL